MNEDCKRKILKWLEEKWPKDKRNWEICGGTDWTISNDIVAPLKIDNIGIKLDGEVYPQAMIICSSCANTKYFNVVAIGITKEGMQ